MNSPILSDDALTSAEQATPFWLTKVLREHETLNHGQSVNKVSIEQLRKTATENISRLTLRYNADYGNRKPTCLFLKIALIGEVEIRQSMKEIAFYARLSVDHPNLPTPICYHTALATEDKCSHILIQDLSTSHQSPTGIIPLKQNDEKQVVKCLANVHATFWCDESIINPSTTLADQKTVNLYNADSAKYLASLKDYLGDRMSDKKLAVLELVISHYLDTLVYHDRIYPFRDKPFTISHCDAHLGNYLLPKNSRRHQVKMIDWQAWMIWFGTIDLAYPIGLDWYPEKRHLFEKDLIKYYHDCLLEAGVVGYDWDVCWLDYRLSIISTMMMPLHQWGANQPAEEWWHRFQMIGIAFDDLDCRELLV